MNLKMRYPPQARKIASSIGGILALFLLCGEALLVVLAKPIAVSVEWTNSLTPATPVSDLVCPCRPAAVAWLVVSIVIDAIKRVARRRPEAHICNKGQNVVPPTVTDDYPSSSVIFIGRMTGVVAAIAHCRPSEIFGAPVLVPRRSMSEMNSLDDLLVQTSTTLRVTATKTLSPNRYFFPALATAKPSGPSLGRNSCRTMNKFDYREATECLS
jgi:hypothetical protein